MNIVQNTQKNFIRLSIPVDVAEKMLKEISQFEDKISMFLPDSFKNGVRKMSLKDMAEIRKFVIDFNRSNDFIKINIGTLGGIFNYATRRQVTISVNPEYIKDIMDLYFNVTLDLIPPIVSIMRTSQRLEDSTNTLAEKWAFRNVEE